MVIIGAGRIGTAIKSILKDKGIKTGLWDKDQSKVSNQKRLSEIVPNAGFLFLCVPSWAVRNVMMSAVEHLNKETIVISLAKGIEKKTLKTMDEIFKEVLPAKQPFAVLGGPMLAEELSRGKKGIGMVGSSTRTVFNRLVELFSCTNLCLEYSADAHGVALAGVLKNVYAIGLGACDTLGLGRNLKGWFAQKALSEMSEIIKILGGKRDTAYSVAGIGDLIATGFSPSSHHRQIGKDLVRTGHTNQQSEGLISMPSLFALLGKKAEEFLLLKTLGKVIMQKQNVGRVVAGIFNEQVK